ncbi:SPOR domain-containing protein [Polaribacter sp.]|uniref:SPOR domain-containing protein n=1 Tax=Polaribacter sp. TaxID=1920175 RepID=UPI0025F67EE3|nr:SPOR domain-containing protein [Polaribacter sp.]
MRKNAFILFFILAFSVSNIDLIAQNKTKSNDKVARLIAKKRAFNKEFGYGYCIQLYYGDEVDARNLKSEFELTFPKVSLKLNYEQPYWKVLTGNYKTKLEADKAMLLYSEKFSGLIVIPLGK